VTRPSISRGPGRLLVRVVDVSFFVSNGEVNPALTIIAEALWVGDHLLERLR